MSTAPPRDSPSSDPFWEEFLTRGGDTWTGAGRRLLKRLPADPRCRMCAAPFAGPGAPLMRLMGKRPSEANPNWCSSCFDHVREHHGGAEIDAAMLFADIRGSTALAESVPPAEFHALLNRFYAVATKVVFAHDGVVDKFVGDELVAVFFPLLSGERFVARAVEAAQALLRAAGHTDPGGPWAPIGAGVHAGRAWYGAVGEGSRVELTVVGDAVNVAARLAAQATAGEILVSVQTAEAAGVGGGLARRSLALKGKEEPIETVTLRVEPGRQRSLA